MTFDGLGSVTTKGQLISKCPFGVFNSPKKATKFFQALEARTEILEKNWLVFLGDLKTPIGHFKIN